MELITIASMKVNEKYNVTYYVGKTARFICKSLFIFFKIKHTIHFALLSEQQKQIILNTSF